MVSGVRYEFGGISGIGEWGMMVMGRDGDGCVGLMWSRGGKVIFLLYRFEWGRWEGVV